MNINGYGSLGGNRRKSNRKKLTGIIIICLILFAGIYTVGIITSDSPEYQMRANAIEENHVLKEQVAELTEETERLKEELAKKDAYINSVPQTDTTPEEETPVPTASAAASPRD